MGEGFAAASRPGPGQWVAVKRTLELWGTQPPAPAHPQARRPEVLEGPGEKAKVRLSPHFLLRGTPQLCSSGQPDLQPPGALRLSCTEGLACSGSRDNCRALRAARGSAPITSLCVSTAGSILS